MKIAIEKILNAPGEFKKSLSFAAIHSNIIDGILSVTWADQHQFIINPTNKGNGVVPIKNNFMSHLVENNWRTQVTTSFIDGLGPGPIDAIFDCNEGIFAVEWETGNISSSHRALNKIALGIIQKKLIGGFLIVPTKKLARYLTDRIGNFEEISPYFPLYQHLVFENGVIGVVGVEFDELSNEVVLIPKGKDGNAIK